MTTSTRIYLGTIITFVLTAAGCQAEESDLEQHAKRCASLCAATQQECADEPEFADPWELSCEVACNFDFEDATQPFATCMDGAKTCDAKDECVGGGPIGSGTGDEESSSNGGQGHDE